MNVSQVEWAPSGSTRFSPSDGTLVTTTSPHVEHFIVYIQRNFKEIGNDCLKSVPSDAENRVPPFFQTHAVFDYFYNRKSLDQSHCYIFMFFKLPLSFFENLPPLSTTKFQSFAFKHKGDHPNGLFFHLYPPPSPPTDYEICLF